MELLNLVNGMAMFTKIKNGELNIVGDVEPFNEAMCQGEVAGELFSYEFIQDRAVWLGVNELEYEEVVMSQLPKFFSLEYDRLNLYFDEDMFCQINLLTVLAYLDRNEYDGQIALYLIDRDYNVIKAIAIAPKGFYDVYQEVVINKRFPETVLPETILDGIIMYLSYKQGSTPIHSFIQDNSHLGEQACLDAIFEQFPEYGLGDTQIIKLINELNENG